MKLTLFLCFLFGICFPIEAQTDPITQVHGARAQGMGNLKVHGNDVWSFFNNPGGLASVKSSTLAIGADQRYGLKELSTLDFASAWVSRYGTWGAGVSRFGGKLFNQQAIGIAFANKLGIVSIGGNLQWFQTQIEGFGSGNGLVFSLGGIAELSPQFKMGASISNLNRGKVSRDTDQRIPTGISMGVNYTPIESLSLQLEIEKDIELSPVVKAGLEYGIKELIFLRTGVNTKPNRIFFGLGLKPGKFSFDYAHGQNSALGSTHHVSFALELSEP